MQSANRSAMTFGAKQLTGGLFNDALYEGEDDCEQDRQYTSTTCNVNNVTRS
jgi:hypothetical protein